MLKSEATHCVNETGKNTVQCQVDTHKENEQRLNDIKSWTNSLQVELKYNIVQAHELLELKERLEYMLKNLEQPLKIAQKNLLYTRETRQGPKLVHDNIEDCFFREIETLQHCEEKFLDEMNKVNSHLTKLLFARNEIELDIKNKEQALSTDECVQLQTSIYSLSSPNSWIANTQSIIQKSQEERKSSQLLYSALRGGMLTSADECFGFWYDTNGAFSTRISEISHAKRQLERRLQKLKINIHDLKKHIDDLRKTMDKKLSLLHLAQIHMEKRNEQFGIELCRDQAIISLLREIRSLEISLDTLTKKLIELEDTLQNLLKTKVTLEHDLKLKQVALFVDREKFLCLRQTFPDSTFKESRYPKKSEPIGGDEPIIC